MEQSFADLLSDAFPERSVLSFADEDLDFEHFNFDETSEEDETDISQENLATKEDVALHQEATGQTAVLSSMETKNVHMAESVDKEQSGDTNDEEDFQSVGVMSMDKIPEETEDYTSSDGEGSVSAKEEEDEEEDMGTGQTPGDLLMTVHCGDEFCDGYKEDRIFAEGQPLAPEGAEKPPVRNEEQGESESDEEGCYFERVPKHGSEMTIKGDEIEEDVQEMEEEMEEEKQEDSSDSERESMKIEQEENVLALCFEQDVENPCSVGPTKARMEFPEVSKQNLQDLISEVESAEHEEKMKDFSGEEHQEAGESFADYPSDFSSCEYVQDGGRNHESKHQSNALACTSDGGSVAKQNTCPERAVTDITWTGRAEDTDEEGNEYLYSIDLEVGANKFWNLDVATGEKDRREMEIVEHVLDDATMTGSDDGGETGESDSYNSSDDEVQVKRGDEEVLDHTCLQDLENNKQQDELHGGSSAAFARWSIGDDYNRADPADFNINWNLDVLTTDALLSEDLLTTEDTDEAETLLSDVTQRLAEDVNSYLVVQREKATGTSPSTQGSLDDSFFFNPDHEAAGITELGQLADDEYEEERNREHERIKAFYAFYDDSDGENGGEGRQIKVQFCTNPLSQVINYETDSSNRDSLSSSTEGEQDPSSAETSEPNRWCQMSATETRTWKHKCLNMLKLTLKISVVITMGLLMFWLATDQVGWFSQASFF